LNTVPIRRHGNPLCNSERRLDRPGSDRGGQPRAFHRDDESRSESYSDILGRAGRAAVEGQENADQAALSRYAMHAHGAVFAEVKVDPDLGQMHVRSVECARDDEDRMVGILEFNVSGKLASKRSRKAEPREPFK
jgi:hypothetical protein